jgi:hypothetical protein
MPDTARGLDHMFSARLQFSDDEEEKIVSAWMAEFHVRPRRVDVENGDDHDDDDHDDDDDDDLDDVDLLDNDVDGDDNENQYCVQDVTRCDHKEQMEVVQSDVPAASGELEADTSSSDSDADVERATAALKELQLAPVVSGFPDQGHMLPNYAPYAVKSATLIDDLHTAEDTAVSSLWLGVQLIYYHPDSREWTVRDQPVSHLAMAELDAEPLHHVKIVKADELRISDPIIAANCFPRLPSPSLSYFVYFQGIWHPWCVPLQRRRKFLKVTPSAFMAPSPSWSLEYDTRLCDEHAGINYDVTIEWTKPTRHQLTRHPLVAPILYRLSADGEYRPASRVLCFTRQDHQRLSNWIDAHPFAHSYAATRRGMAHSFRH